MWYIHIVEYYSAIERNGVSLHAIARMNHGNMMLSERPHIVSFHLYEISRISKSIETGERLGVAQGWGEGGIGDLKSTGFLSETRKMF